MGEAEDGNDRNGVYTKHLWRYMVMLALSIGQMLIQDRVAVMAETGAGRSPGNRSSSPGSFLLRTSCALSEGKLYISLPDTFCHPNFNMKSDRNEEVCMQKMIKKAQTHLEYTYITAISTMENRHPIVLRTEGS